MTTIYMSDHGNSMLYEPDESAALGAQNEASVDNYVGDDVILITQVYVSNGGACNKAGTAASVKLQFKRDSGSWTDVGASTEIAYSADTTLVNDAGATNRGLSAPAGCGGVYETGKECTDAACVTPTTDKEGWTDIHWALNTDNAVPGLYTFQVYSITGSAVLSGTVGTSLEAKAAPVPLNIPNPYDGITVTDVPTIQAVIRIDDISINLAEATTISVFDEVDVAEDVTVTTFTPTIPVSVFDEITMLPDVTVALSGAGINVEDGIALTEYLQVEVIIDFSVYDEVSVGEDVALLLSVTSAVFDSITLEDEGVVQVMDVTDVTPPWDDYDQDGTIDDSTNTRFIIPEAKIIGSGNSVSISLASKGTTWSFDSLYIGHPADSGDAYDFDGNQVQVLFGGLAGATINATTTSDIVLFDLDASKPLIFAFFFNDATSVPEKISTTTYDLYYKIGTDESADSDVTAYTQHPTYYLRRFIGKITVYSQSQGGELVISSADSIALTEFVKKAVTPQHISVYSEVGVTDDVTAVMGDIAVFAFTQVTVDEYLEFSTSLGGISVYSSLGVTDWGNVDLTIISSPEVNVFDELTVTDAITVLLTDIEATVYDELTVTDEVTINNSLLYTSVYDEVSVDEDVSFAFESTISLYDSVTVQESITLSNLIAGINTFSEVAVTEFTNVSMGGIFLDIFDAVNVGEFTDFTNNLFRSVYDDITVVDFVSVSNQPAGINVFDTITVAEFVTVFAGHLTISAYDEVTILDIPVVNAGSPTNLYVTVNDETAITEFVLADAIAGNKLTVNDLTGVTEFVSVELSALVANAYDEISVFESVDLAFDSFISVNDEITVGEYVVASVGDLGISKIDSVSVTEYVLLQNILSGISVNDALAVTDTVNILCELSGISVYDSITVSEDVAVNLGIAASYQISVVDTVTAIEYNDLFSPVYSINVSDTIIVTEAIYFLIAFIVGKLKINVDTDGMEVYAETAGMSVKSDTDGLEIFAEVA